MPRMGRIVLPNYPHHVVQRGHNRQVVFAATEDYQRYLADLRELKEVFGVRVYAYCLMTSCPFVVGAKRIGGRPRAVNEGAGGACYSLPQSVGGAYRYAMGESVQVQCGAIRYLSVGMLPLY